MNTKSEFYAPKTVRRKRRKKKDYQNNGGNSTSIKTLKCGKEHSEHLLSIRMKDAYLFERSVKTVYRYSDPKLDRLNPEKSLNNLVERVLRGTMKGQFERALVYSKDSNFTKPNYRYNKFGLLLTDKEIQEIGKPNGRFAHNIPLLKVQLNLRQSELDAIRKKRQEIISIHGTNSSALSSLKERPIFNSIDCNSDAETGYHIALKSLHEMCIKGIYTNRFRNAMIYRQSDNTRVADFDWKGRINWKCIVLQKEVLRHDKSYWAIYSNKKDK